MTRAGTGPRTNGLSESTSLISSVSLSEETDEAGDEQELLEVKEPDSESPLALEVPRVLEDEARDNGRVPREPPFPEEIVK